MSRRDMLSTPYRIPGPAGSCEAGENTREHPASRPGSSPAGSAAGAGDARFQRGPWAVALRSLCAPPFGQDELSTSISILRGRALAVAHAKATTLVVRIDAMNFVGKDAAVVLTDPTGSVAGTLHAEVIELYRQAIQPGTVLLLADVWALAALERRVTGFRVDPSDAVHMSVHPSNVKSVFLQSHSENEPEISCPSLDSYEAAVRRPPLVRPGLNSRPVPSEPLLMSSKSRPQFSASPHLSSLRTRARPVPLSAPPLRPPGTKSSVGARTGDSASHQQVHPPLQKRSSKSHVSQPVARRPRLASPAVLGAGSRVSNLIPKKTIEPCASVPNAVTEMSDDMLDDLLGDIDIDAAIAASGKASSQIAVARSESAKKINLPPPLPIEPRSTSAVTLEETKKPDAAGLKSLAPAACQVDDDMIENLMQGLDGDDFADI